MNNNKDKEYNFSLMSLEEDNQTNKQNIESQRKIKNVSKDSFFKQFFNSMSKIGQGLKNIMSMRINIEEEDEDNNYYQDIYSQVSNRFNTNEEISLIDAPSFMEESHSKNFNTIQNEKGNENNKEQVGNMIISHDEIKKDENEFNSFNKYINNSKEEIINTDFLNNSEKNTKIKSTLLNNKRERDKNLSLIQEEEKNDNKDEDQGEVEFEKEKLKSSIKSKQKKAEKEKSIISRNNFSSNNINDRNNKMNSSIMSLSMKSLDNIKSEINQRREENLRSIEEMHKRNGLYYDYIKERQIREKILEDYYKEKAKRIAEGKLQMEKEKRKREEDFQKLKIRKATMIKYGSISKKPKILSKTNSAQIQFEAKPIIQTIKANIKSSENESNNANISFGNKNNNFNLQNNEINEKKNDNNKSDKKGNTILFSNSNDKSKDIQNETESNDKPISSLFSNNNPNKIVENNKKEEPSKNILDNKEKSSFDNQNPLFNVPHQGGLFGPPILSSNQPQNQLFNSINNPIFENKKEENQHVGNEQKSDMKRLFTTSENENKSIFPSNSDNSKSLFFNVNDQNNKKEEFLPQQKEVMFKQDTTVSESINVNTLFTSNQPEKNENNQKQGLFSVKDNDQKQGSLFGKDNDQKQGSLFGNGQISGSLLIKNNPFIQGTPNNIPNSLFGNNQKNDNYQNKPSLFGN